MTFLDEVSTARENVKDLKSKNVSIIVLLTHVGLDKDKKIANMVDDIDIIVGGHSHTHLFTGNNTTPDIAEDEYPVVITSCFFILYFCILFILIEFFLSFILLGNNEVQWTKNIDSTNCWTC